MPKGPPDPERYSRRLARYCYRARRSTTRQTHLTVTIRELLEAKLMSVITGDKDSPDARHEHILPELCPVCSPKVQQPRAGFDPASQFPPSTNPDEPAKFLALDVDFETARAVHRVVRAMHDGECPFCHTLRAADEMRKVRDGQYMHRCPSCGFTITQEQSEAAIKLFAEPMRRAVEIFERWRSSHLEWRTPIEVRGEPVSETIIEDRG